MVCQGEKARQEAKDKFGFIGGSFMVGDGALDIPHISTRTETKFDAQTNG